MRKVMLVEDEELILKGLCNIIEWEELGMKVVHLAHNGQEALELWRKEPVDIVVTDISMPVMDGLEFLRRLRETEERARAVILTGYDEFDYARKAICLSVEDYILKPIDEEKLTEVLLKAEKNLREYDRSKSADIDEKIAWVQFFHGKLSGEEFTKYVELFPGPEEGALVYLALMKLDMETLINVKMTDILTELKKEERMLRAIYLSSDSLVLLYEKGAKADKPAAEVFTAFQDEVESKYGVMSFISMAEPFTDYGSLPVCYSEAEKLQKYRVIEGYGSFVEPERIHKRQTGLPAVDNSLLRKLILKKDKDAAIDYLQDLFINIIKEETPIDDVYHMCLKIALLLQEVKEEYKLTDRENMHNLAQMTERIFHAEDLSVIKTVFVGEIVEIIACLHEEHSQYTPVVKQIMEEVKKNYKEDMNLKTLSYKYHMNASYLGQLFQKEVGCSFAQYLSNTKNSIAKNLILNTNMKINDIAREVGYPDTSYFYRKFKLCYGVSPASLRDMKKY